jgi:creatinine amidohydrolase
MLMHLASDLVREDRLTDARDGGLLEWGSEAGRQFGARTFFDAIENTDNGVLGDQTDATAEKGETLFEAACDQLVQLCEWLDRQAFADLAPPGHV